MIDLTPCPECGGAAEVEDRSALFSTDGPMEHVRLRCVRRHWFLMPVALLPSAAAEPALAPDRSRPGGGQGGTAPVHGVAEHPAGGHR
jgi:hypothetical protein